MRRKQSPTNRPADVRGQDASKPRHKQPSLDQEYAALSKNVSGSGNRAASGSSGRSSRPGARVRSLSADMSMPKSARSIYGQSSGIDIYLISTIQMFFPKADDSNSVRHVECAKISAS